LMPTALAALKAIETSGRKANLREFGMHRIRVRLTIRIVFKKTLAQCVAITQNEY